jgi:hypothetical protein
LRLCFFATLRLCVEKVSGTRVFRTESGSDWLIAWSAGSFRQGRAPEESHGLFFVPFVTLWLKNPWDAKKRGGPFGQPLDLKPIVKLLPDDLVKGVIQPERDLLLQA